MSEEQGPALESLAAVMREIIIYLMNARTGYDPETGENPAKAEDFFWAQGVAVRLRRKAIRVAKKQGPGDPLSAAQIAQGMLALMSLEGVRWEDVAKMGSGVLLRACRRLKI
jgi:hypothetical protein